MAWLPNPIACDVCGVIKQPSNDWWYAEIRPNERFAEYESKINKRDKAPESQNFFLIRPWDDFAEQDKAKPYTHLCGQACAIRKLNEYMTGKPTTQQPQWTPDGPILTEE
jgi:hypothetical protein